MAVTLLFGGFPHHPKVKVAGERAGWLFIYMLDHCAVHGTDGYVSDAIVSEFRLAGTKDRLHRLENARLAPDRDGLIHRAEGGWLIHDYHDWNHTSAELAEKDAAKRAARSAAGKKGAAARWNGKLGKPDGKRSAVANGSTTGNERQDDGSGSGSGSCSGSVDHPHLPPYHASDDGSLEPGPCPDCDLTAAECADCQQFGGCCVRCSHPPLLRLVVGE